MRILLALACGLTGYGQAVPILPPTTVSSGIVLDRRSVSVTISRQDKMAKALASLDMDGYNATLCSADGGAINIGGGAARQLAERGGLRLLNLHVAAVAATQARAKSGWEVAGVVTGEMLFEVATVAALDIVHVKPSKGIGKLWRAAPIILGRKVDALNAERAKIQPDPIATFAPDMLYGDVVYAIPSGFGICIEKLLIASPGGPKSVTGDIQIP